ncbi:enoyl-CoA hydratase-related protein [Gordonia sp. CPCC 205515]|uniref:enoyl-CoA hydratase/isomerase family protein n=1 Tax=Gordonia sp. CPCC 205515 TaxID=3140791 RepID=UPI003AF39A0D
MDAHIHYRVDDRVATVTIDNRGRRNAVSFSIFEQLKDSVAELEQRPDVGVVILTGRGADFSVGADLAAPADSRTLRGTSVAADTERLTRVSRMVRAFHRLPQVTIAAIDGACAGAGLSLAVAADFRIATERAKFSTAFVRAGLSGDLGGAWFITRLVGVARARELLLDPRTISATEALRLGLVTSVTTSDTLMDTAAAFAQRLAESAPMAMHAMKQNVLDAEIAPLPDYLTTEVHRMVQCFHSDDAREAAAAFLEKRRPAFVGR